MGSFFEFRLANHTSLSIYGAERGIYTFHFITERGCDYETIRLSENSTMSF